MPVDSIRPFPAPQGKTRAAPARRRRTALTVSPFRRIDHPPSRGAWNMAVDESLLEACIAGEPGFPCVRFYAWSPAALSLGFHQDAESAADLAVLRRNGIDLVRRPTGGRAVLHQHELTYAVIASSRIGPLAGPVMTSYRRISEALVEGLLGLGLAAQVSPGEPSPGRASAEPCFARVSACEVALDGRKSIGSVQLRRRGCLLQHGSIPLRHDAQLLAVATRAGRELPAAGIEASLGRRIGLAELADALASGFEKRFGAPLERGDLRPEERERAERLATERYGSPAWNHDPPARRPAAGPVAAA